MAKETTKQVEEGAGKVPQWAMSIDLDRCTGCEACMLACSSENNIPTAGPEQSAMGRSKQWIRIDRYYEGEFPNIKVKYRPVLCQHCDDAPCEPVCPVFATYQNAEGLNVQVYNRCIGTRYCANNCPYTVRFFNWFASEWDGPLDLQLNPDVSIRPAGVVEKCTFCAHKIKRAKLDADAEDRELADGDVQPACVRSCPAEAMVFGDMSDPDSQVSKMISSGRSEQLLSELGTKPRVFYLSKSD